MRRFLTLLLVVMLSLSSLAAAETTYPLTTEPVTLKIAVAQHSSDAVTDFNTKYALADAAAVTGVTIEWIPVVEGNNEQIATLLAGDMPDVFLGLLTDWQITQNYSLFLETEDLIETYCPNIYETYESSVDGWRNFLTYPDGHMYGLIAGYYSSYYNSIEGTMWINKQWLDNLGLAVPTTLPELEQVLTAFRDNDADGDGDTTNEIPMDFCQKHYASTYKELAYSFGLPKYYDIQDSKVLPTVNTDTYRTFLSYYHTLCTEGLANVEGLTQTEEQYYANISNGKVGVFWGWAPYTYTSDAALQAQYVATGPLSADGHTFRVQPNRMTANRCGFVVTSACENPELALQWWDYLSRDQAAATTARMGPEGLTWEMIDGVATSRVYTAEDAIAFGYDSLAGHVGTSTFIASMGLTNCFPFTLKSLYPVAGTTSAIRADVVALYEPFFTEQSMAKSVIPSEAQEEFDFTCEGLEEYIDNASSDAILNGVTDESWSAFLAGLDQLNYEYYIQFYQNYMDGAF